MSTQRQIEANRRNAANSKGPRSAEGKATSRMNALRSGIHAESSIIKGEDPDALNQLTQSFYSDYQPANQMERAQLDNIIRDTWLLTRFFRIEAEMLDHEIESTFRPVENNTAGKAFMDSSRDQLRLQRRINDTRRSQMQAFKELQRLQAERHAAPPVQEAQPPDQFQDQPLDATAVPSTSNQQIGFVSQTPSEAPAEAPFPLPPAARIGFFAGSPDRLST